MANDRNHTVVSFLFICVLLVKVLQSQELNQSGEECDECWGRLDHIVDTVATRIASYYRQRERICCTEEDVGSEEPEAHFERNIFRQSESPSSSLECQACWVVLKRLKSETKPSRGRAITKFRQLVKKTMLNNGWV